MSAFMCNDVHIAALARAIHLEIQPPNGRNGTLSEDQIATELTHANAKSVSALYREESLGDVARREGFVAATLRNYGVHAVAKPFGQCASIDPVRLMKSIDCFNYQASETDDWEDSAVHRWLMDLRHAASKRVRGYDEADWGPPFPRQQAK